MVYFTVIAPYVLIGIFLWRACSLDGADKGLVFLFKPRWELLKDAKVMHLETAYLESIVNVPIRRYLCVENHRPEYRKRV